MSWACASRNNHRRKQIEAGFSALQRDLEESLIFMDHHADRNMNEQSKIRMDYFDYKLLASPKFIRVMFFIAGMFNLLLLIPDLLIVQGPPISSALLF
jgi:hypothetical protein